MICFDIQFKCKTAYFDEKEQDIFDAATSNPEENLRFLVSAVLVRALLGIAIALLAAFLISSGIAKTISDAVNAIATSSTEIAATVKLLRHLNCMLKNNQTLVGWASRPP